LRHPRVSPDLRPGTPITLTGKPRRKGRSGKRRGSGGRKLCGYKIDQQSRALLATGRRWDDGIIDPRATRTVVALSLSAAYSREVEGTTSFGVFRH